MTLGGFGAASDKIFDARPNLLTPTSKIARARETQRGLAKFYFSQVPRSKLPVAVALVILPVVPEAAWPRCPLYPRKRTSFCTVAMSALLPKADMDYSITSSTRASTAGGTVRPSAFAVLRLMTNAYLAAPARRRASRL
jgi:hypothetical protein